MYIKSFFYTLITFFGILKLGAQDPTFSSFEGSVYRIPEYMRNTGYGNYIQSQDVIKKISWDEVNVSERFTDEAFPDIDDVVSFGIIFNTTMRVDSTAWYMYSLSSDDGTRLWINDRQIINNDGDHKFKEKKDSLLLTKGIHDVKIWYYQAYHIKYGCVFDASYYRPCNLEEMVSDDQSYELSSDVLFEYNKEELSKEGVKELDELLSSYYCSSNVSIQIIGYTDSKGSKVYNQKLSQRRSDVVAKIIQKSCPIFQLTSEGRGESELVLDEKGQEDAAKSRRVLLKFKERNRKLD